MAVRVNSRSVAETAKGILMGSLWNRLVRRLRRWAGCGWSAREFRHRYAGKPEDVWGYLHSQPHQDRSDRIFSAFAGRRPQRLLELGCAEGFLTRRLAGLADEVVACDLSEVAVQRAQAYCSDLNNVRFLAADVRNRLPDGSFDECLASDVLYYLSPGEIQVLGQRLRQLLGGTGRLVFANEWNQGYCDLTAPEAALRCLAKGGKWVCVRQDNQDLGQGRSHFLAVLE